MEPASGVTLVFGVEIKYLRHSPPADLLLFNVKLVLVSICVCDPSQKQYRETFTTLSSAERIAWWSFHKLWGKGMPVV